MNGVEYNKSKDECSLFYYLKLSISKKGSLTKIPNDYWWLSQVSTFVQTKLSNLVSKTVFLETNRYNPRVPYLEKNIDETNLKDKTDKTKLNK